MNKYTILLRILDQIRAEAAATKVATRYADSPTDPEHANHARARAFVHLYLKVAFGLIDFGEREHFITDGAYDGGVDGYYIHRDSRTVYLIQSKFRANQTNFENKHIQPEELLSMDISRILSGELNDEQGNAYNGKIRQLAREISEIGDVGRYKYQVILLANVGDIPSTKLKQLIGGYPVRVLNHDRCYDELVFPVVSGTYFSAADLKIHIDLSNKNAGSKISYAVATALGECEITVLFVPTIEIARAMHHYKNSILKFNPRSYLELDGAKVNGAIRETITRKTTNEFALFNNGITMISDETSINERIGQKNKAQLVVRNPQIINGGQTAYTLGRLWAEDPANADLVFGGKEVLLKVITLAPSVAQGRDTQKLELVDQISTATNQQTIVINADRYSNNDAHLQIQRSLYERYGVFYERKRGEFSDGVHNGYVDRARILERNLFFRIFFASNGQIDRAQEKKLFSRLTDPLVVLENERELDRFYFGYLAACRLDDFMNPQRRPIGLYGKVFAIVNRYMPKSIPEFESALDQIMPQFDSVWRDFLLEVSKNPKYLQVVFDKESQERREKFSLSRWIKGPNFKLELQRAFGADGTTSLK